MEFKMEDYIAEGGKSLFLFHGFLKNDAIFCYFGEANGESSPYKKNNDRVEKYL